MISRLGLAISRVFEKTAPDPFVIAILLSLLTAILAIVFGIYPQQDLSLAKRLVILLDSWRFDITVPVRERNGVWKLLEFSMQMCLILVTGHALAVTRPVRAMIKAVAQQPRSSAAAAAMVSFFACATALVNWGLGLIVGALLARAVGRSMQQRGIRAHYPLIVAAGYMGLMVWHGGLSGSAPLNMTTYSQAVSVIPADVLAAVGLKDRGVGLDQTTFSPMNLFISLGMLVIVPVMFLLMAPKRDQDMRPMATFGIDLNDDAPAISHKPHKPHSVPEWLEQSMIVPLALAVPLLWGLWRFANISGWRSIGLNEVNAAMLALGLILHGSSRSYMAAVEQGARGCAGIIIQFPLYAGIMAMMQSSGLARRMAEVFTAHGNEVTVPFMSFLAAGVINLFIPSGGGQWAVQGPIALMAGHEVGVPPAKMIMTVAYGDQLTNMLQPFWALPLLAITGVKARDIIGYSALVMLVAGTWIALGLLVF